MSVAVNGEVVGPYNPSTSDNDRSIVAKVMREVGAVIESSQWSGWTPGSCPGGQGLGSSHFEVRNVRVEGSVVQGPEPTAQVQCQPQCPPLNQRLHQHLPQ